MSDGWQIVNGWDVADWSLTVGGDTERPAGRAGRSRRAARFATEPRRVVGSARATLSASIRSEAVGYVIDTEEEELLLLMMLDWL